MNILGINAYSNVPSTTFLKDSRVRFAAKEEIFSREIKSNIFPKLSCRHSKVYIDKLDAVAYANKPSFFSRRNIKNNIKKHIYGKYAIEFFDKDDCYAMGGLANTNWDRCAVLLVKSFSANEFATRVGYISNNSISWIKNFQLEDSIGTFYTQANKFLCNNNILSLSPKGSPIWADFLRETFIGDNFSLNYDIANIKSVPKFPLDENVISSFHLVVSLYILELANWLQKETNCNNLVYVGDLTKDYLINGFLKRNSNFENISVSPVSSDAITSLGAASFLERPIISSYDTGIYSDLGKNSEEIANIICNRQISPVIYGQTEFSDFSLGTRCLLAAPTPNNIETFRKILEIDNFTIVCNKEAADVYIKELLPVTQYSIVQNTCSYNPVGSKVPVLLADNNFFLKAILSKTTNKGFPILIMAPLQRKNYPLVNTVYDYQVELSRLVSKFA